MIFQKQYRIQKHEELRARISGGPTIDFILKSGINLLAFIVIKYIFL